MTLRCTVLCLLFACLAATAAGQAPPFALAAPFQDHLVLQRDREIRVSGTAAPGDTVTVTLAEHTASAAADAGGRWITTLPPMPAGGPHVLTARTAAGESRTVSDVLVGDVWICSGQSNMEWPVSRTLNARAEIASSANDRLRLLQVPHASSAAPREAFAPPIPWRLAGPDSIGDFSGTCYYFARELQKTVDVPMGLIHASWGGSRIEPWLSDAGLRTLHGFDESLDVLRLYADDPRAGIRRFVELWETWWRTRAPASPNAEPWRPAAGQHWEEAPQTLGNWKSWGVPELASFDGMVWYRRTVRLTAAQAALGATLALGGIDEVDVTWVNGQAIGTTFGWGTERAYEVPAGLLHAGDNVIVVNVLSTYASGGLLGPSGAMRLQLADGTAVPLGGGWRYETVPADIGPSPRAPWESVGGLTTLYNAMVAPLGAFPARGVLWYQGESNTGQPEAYEALLTALMADWRRAFGADAAFLVVQLPNFGRAPTEPVESGWASLRDAQRRAVSRDPRAALVVTIDIGMPQELHPPNKQDVGRRLARAARHVVYGEAVSPSGPVPLSVSRELPRVAVTFGEVEQGLVALSARQPIGFELCGADQGSCRFVSATIESNRVLLDADDVPGATRVRYCWGDAPICTLYDGSGLPAGPFELPVQ
jgi:sialate O-acetylesterase